MLADLDALPRGTGLLARAHLRRGAGRCRIKLNSLCGLNSLRGLSSLCGLSLCGRLRAPRQELLADAAVAFIPAAPAVDLPPRPIFAGLWLRAAFDSFSFGRRQSNFESKGKRNSRSEGATQHDAGLSVEITHENDALQSGAEQFEELLACSASRLRTDAARSHDWSGADIQCQSLPTAMRWLYHGALNRLDVVHHLRGPATSWRVTKRQKLF